MISSVRPGNFKLGRFFAVRGGQSGSLIQLNQDVGTGRFEGLEGRAFTGDLFTVNLVQGSISCTFPHRALEWRMNVGIGGAKINGVDAVNFWNGFGHGVLHFTEFRPSGTDF